VISSYRNSFFNPHNYEVHQKAIASARAGNVIGGGDWAKDRIIPDIVRALSKNEPGVVRNPRSIRPWQHVLEPIGGYLLLGAKMQENPTEFSTAWNFGPLTDDTLDVESLVRKAIDIWGSGIFVKHQLQNVQHEATMLKLDISKTTSELGWKPIWNADIAIEHTLLWYKNWFKNLSSKELMEENLCTYTSA
jgi:CDP-glucose 4,6-dehydratase